MSEAKGDVWETEHLLFRQLDQVFKFGLDAAAEHETAKCGEYFTAEDDALIREWNGRGWVWLNPPYSRVLIKEFMAKVHTQVEQGVQVVTLTRFDPTTDWFKRHVDGVARKVLMLGDRVIFHGASNCYNFPCMVSIFDRSVSETEYVSWVYRSRFQEVPYEIR